MVFISGQVAWDAQKRVGGGVSLLEQTRQVLRNVQAAVEAAGGTLKDVVILRIYVVNFRVESAEAVGSALREFFAGDNPPASTWIGLSTLAVPDSLIEIEANALLD
jgi:enamine deaminase RidA (YjgF/YER057c/UK114 family)